MRYVRLGLVVVGVSAGFAIAVACSSSSDSSGSPAPDASLGDAGPRGVEQAGQACTSAAQCYPDKAAQDAGEAGAQLAIKGAITCLDRVPNGYCTHVCTSDSDCCAVPGECRTGIKQVCSPFTNDSTTKYCFLSCESADIQAGIAANVAAGGWDGGAYDGGLDNGYCYYYASIYATCRSSGGGAQNRQVCIPQQ